MDSSQKDSIIFIYSPPKNKKMAKVKEVKEVSNTEVATLENTITGVQAFGELDINNNDEIGFALMQMKQGGVNLSNWDMESGISFTPEEGVTYIVFVKGMGEGENQAGQKYPVVDIVTEDGTERACHEAVFVSTVEKHIKAETGKVPGFWSIFWNGQMKQPGNAKFNEYKVLDIRSMPKAK